MKNKIKYFFSTIMTIIIVIALFIIENEQPNNIIQKRQIETIPASQLKNADFMIQFIDVGQADCILIQSKGKNALVDAGNNKDGKKLVNYFQNLGITSFQYLIATHPHEDHIGGMDDIIKNFQVEKYYMPDIQVDMLTYTEIIDALNKKGIKPETPVINSTFFLGEAEFKIIWISNKEEDINDTSIIIKITYKNTSYLLTGDATSNVEKKILQKDIKSDVLKVGHHGSKYSSSAQFLKIVNPQIAVITVEENNDYGLPKDVVIDKLEYLGTKIYRTDKDGTIILTSDGNNINIQTTKTDTNEKKDGNLNE